MQCCAQCILDIDDRGPEGVIRCVALLAWFRLEVMHTTVPFSEMAQTWVAVPLSVLTGNTCPSTVTSARCRPSGRPNGPDLDAVSADDGGRE